MNHKDENEYNELSWDSLFAMASYYEEPQNDDTSNLNVGLANHLDTNEISRLENNSGTNIINKLDDKQNDNKDVKQVYHTPEAALKGIFGYDEFREGQKEIIDQIMAKRDILAVMPTGAGKSICYQIPSVLLEGVSLVVSPLISLMQDQVKALNEVGISAAYINSSLSEKAFVETLQNVKQGRYKIIYVAPERLLTEGFLEVAKNITISMITVDEAHCISQWGQDFRPSYKKIIDFVGLIPRRPVISAFTATATENVRIDIERALQLRNPFLLVTGFNRENLFFQVDRPKNKDAEIIDFLERHLEDSGIIYCATRKNVDNLFDVLNARGLSVGKYHAGMSAEERKKMQNNFVYDYTKIMVATNAFGMGIDKSNVRFVIHYNMPQSMENYYQEAGRAGRDGLDAKCILLYSPQDTIINRYLLEHKEMTDLTLEEKENVRLRDNYRLRVMEGYCTTTDCLRNYILRYFGESPDVPCEECGNCLHEYEIMDMTDEAKKVINCVFETKGRFGRNIVMDILAGAKTAKLEDIGAFHYKSYSALSSINRNLMKRLIEQMILDGYLEIGDYQVVKLGDYSLLKMPETKVLVKITDEDKNVERQEKRKKKATRTEISTNTGNKLFERLRELRLEIAREEKMPPYIIFSDKTLIDMVAKIPMSREEMLRVSGVGDHKYMKYGKQFLDVIQECCEAWTELKQEQNVSYYNADESYAENNNSYTTKAKNKKREFSLLSAEAEKFQYSELRYISEIKEEMNRVCERDDVKKIQTIRLTEILLEEGYIVEAKDEGKYAKKPTQKGIQCGIQEIEKVSQKGFSYTILMYPENIQRILVEHYIEN